MNIFLTGGMGYIGSHTAVVLLQEGYNVIIYDNLSNSNISVLDAIEKVTGKRPLFIKGDIRDEEKLKEALQLYKANVVIHFAGLKSVSESVDKPIEYYDNNVVGTIQLLKAMSKVGVNCLIFHLRRLYMVCLKNYLYQRIVQPKRPLILMGDQNFKLKRFCQTMQR